MRIILSILGVILLLIAMAFVPTTRNYMVKHVAEFYLSGPSFKVRIGHLDAQKTHIQAKDTAIYVNGENLTTIENIAIDYDLDEILKSRKLNFSLKFQDKTTLLTKDAEFDADIKYTSDAPGLGEAQITITRLASDVFSDLGINALHGACNISSSNGTHHIGDCKITDGKANLELEAKIGASNSGMESLMIKGNAQALPIDLHKTFHHMVAEDATMQYLYDNISGAILRDGNWEINFDHQYFVTGKMKPEYINGEFKVENISLSYDKDFPVITKINTILHMKGSVLDFEIPSAYTEDTLLSNARVVIDWGVEGDADVVINADCKGPAVNLVSFIPKKEIGDLAETGLDLTKINGVANSKVHLIVPIGDKKNTYDTSSNITGVGLVAYDGAGILSNGSLTGVLNGEMINISGNAIINDFASSINFTNFMDEKAEFDNIMEIKAKLAPPAQSNLVRPYSIVAGNALLEFSYKNKGEKAQILAKSNLLNAEFGIDKLGIHSNVGDKAQLEIKGETASDNTIPLNLKLTGENGLQILGTANIGKDITKVSLSKIRAMDTDAKADIEMGKKSMKIKLRGTMLDLSKSNMMQFLAKNSDGTETALDVSLDRVKLKNGIYLDNFVLTMNCDKTHCYKGSMASKVGTRDFTMALTAKDDYEEWRINTDNAGAIFKGVGMMDNVKSGTLLMNIETRRSDVKAGQTIPIARGDFLLKKFVTVDNKFLTRLISFTSIPGMLNLLRNNHDISFTRMAGEFSYKNDELQIIDGSAEGPFMDLTIKGNVFTNERKMKVKGKVSPSKYGPGIVTKIPIIGQVFKMTPYSIEYKY